MSSPPRSTRPSSGCSKPAMTRSVVVLPEPDGPSSVKNSPAATSTSTPATATTSPYVLRTPRRETSAGKAGFQDVEAALELLVADRERRQQPDHVSVDAAGEQHEPAFARLRRDAGGLVAGAFGQLDREHRAEPTHVAARGRDRLEPRSHAHAELIRARTQA